MVEVAQSYEMRFAIVTINFKGFVMFAVKKLEALSWSNNLEYAYVTPC
jgi:hypothetical protein